MAGDELQPRRPTLHRLPLLAAATATVGLAGAVAVAGFYLGWRILLPACCGAAQPSVTEALDLVKIALALAGGMGGAVALTVALRRQRLSEAEHQLLGATHVRDDARLFNERFDSAARLLGGTESATVRLAGVYALASLADDWPDGRQACIDVLCGYLRLPYAPDSAPPGEREIRVTVLEVIEAHLRRGHRHGWHGQEFNLERATFDGLTIEDACLEGGRLRLAGARFVGAGLMWRRGAFTNAHLDGPGLTLDGGSLSFAGSHFQDTVLSFPEATITAGALSLREATICDGYVDLHGMTLAGGGVVDFEDCRLWVTARGALRRQGRVSRFPISARDRAHSHHRLVDLSGSRLDGGLLGFRNARIGPDEEDRTFIPDEPRGDVSLVSLDDSTVGAARLDFSSAVFSVGEVSFASARLGPERAGAAQTPPAEIIFDRARFAGGAANFRLARVLRADLLFTQVYVRAPGAEEAWEAIAKSGAQWLRETSYPALGLPPAIIDCSDAVLVGGRIVIDPFDLEAAVVDLKGAALEGTEISFGGLAGRLILVLWRTAAPGEGGRISHARHRAPRILIHHPPTAAERDRFGLADAPEVREILAAD